ncbi:MAG: ABC transporter ATP-binding protein [Rhodocyclaceae bacterium]|nr:ABC transporter ATP-binding protein [Rhodocyclaceae bacterium]MBX3669592.1 ABC transporter ATP-binding protein [Rhodocyclaceae bacterium]
MAAAAERCPVAFVSLSGVDKDYALGATAVRALRGIDLEIARGEFMAVWGPSGSGKTSLLNLIGLLDKPTRGSVHLEGERVDRLPDARLARTRARHIGIVFQSFNLVPVLDACENVMLPLQIAGQGARAAREIALRRLDQVGLGEHCARRPDQLSGGQRQRVAIARALAASPGLVIADEPTANLDSETSLAIVELMRELNRRDGVTFLFSTHDPRLLERVDRRVHLQDGRIIAEPA